MNTQEAITATMDVSSMVLTSYLKDLTDAELMTCPGDGCNHIAWQLGHLIASECNLLNAIQPGAAAELPEGFDGKHSKETIGEDDPAKFCTKQEYLDLLDKVRDASKAALANASDDDLDGPSPEQFRERFPTVGSLYVLISTHGMMHAGQFVPVRRALGKPVVI